MLNCDYDFEEFDCNFSATTAVQNATVTYTHCWFTSGEVSQSASCELIWQLERLLPAGHLSAVLVKLVCHGGSWAAQEQCKVLAVIQASACLLLYSSVAESAFCQ